MYEVAWREINSRWEIVTKRKSFRTATARDRFCKRLMEKSSFYGIIGYRDAD